MSVTLVGRDRELAAARDVLARARGGRGQLPVISGEAGLGKSALATAFADAADGFAVTWGRAWEVADAPAYFPVWSCLRALGVAPEGDAFALWERVLERLAVAGAVVWI